jgi:DNA processing protein
MEWTDERIAHLAFLQTPKIGSNRIRALKTVFGSLQAAWHGTSERFRAAGLPTEACEAFRIVRKNFDAEKTIHTLEEQGISFALREDPDYPALLHQTSDQPEALFIRGQIRALPWIALVGSRNMTSYGERCVNELVPDLVRAGCGIVSGLALGVDGAVHRAALATEGYTIAFLGGGIDEASLYPRSHVDLAHKILAQGGALVSEFAPGTASRSFHFPLRNRLIAGSSLATIVVEATLDSGSLITAKSALEENREVFAVPGPIWSSASAGCHRLIQSGAQLCTRAEDILRLLKVDRPQVMEEAQARLPLDALERRILAELTEPRSLDLLARRLELAPGKLSAALSLLELKGLVASLEGQGWLAKNQKPSLMRQTSL